MPIFKIKVTQVLRKEREAVIEVEEASLEKALEAVGNGEYDLPSSDSPFWGVKRETVEHEEARLA